MTNFIIDTSVFSLPPKSDNWDIEGKNLCLFKENIKCLKYLQQNDSVTISYMNKILLCLRNNKRLSFHKDIEDRIIKLLENSPGFGDKIGFDSVLFEGWNDFLTKKTRPRKDEKTGVLRKGNIGILNNIPDRDSDPAEEYLTKTIINGKDDFYPELPEDFKKTFIKYCGYIAELNQKYHSFENNFIALGTRPDSQSGEILNIALKKDTGDIQSQVNVIEIRKAKSMCRNDLKFKDLQSACEEAKNKFSEKLFFGKDTNKENIKKNLSQQAGTPKKVYLYLQTLYKVSKIITENNIDFETNASLDLVEMLNAHGLLSSHDDEKYMKYHCIHRKFENEDNKKVVFSVHLKPSTYACMAPEEDDEDGTTYTLASRNTVRIYLDWNKGKKNMCIGWIGCHPAFCRDCEHSKCQAKSMF